MSNITIEVDEAKTSCDVEWFKNELLERGVSAFEIVWGNYKAYFYEVPPHLLSRYLHHRGTLLHQQALKLSLFEELAMEDHPFAC